MFNQQFNYGQKKVKELFTLCETAFTEMGNLFDNDPENALETFQDLSQRQQKQCLALETHKTTHPFSLVLLYYSPNSQGFEQNKNLPFLSRFKITVRNFRLNRRETRLSIIFPQAMCAVYSDCCDTLASDGN